MKSIRKYVNNSNGQSVVFLLLLLTLMVGFAALAIDIGQLYANKTNMQNVVDAAALAGAQDLPNTATAKSTALNYAVLNGADSSGITTTAPYDGDNKQIEVTYTQTVSYSFAHVLGISSRDVTVRAVAESKSYWDGDALPFVNLDDSYSGGDEIVAWEKTGPGDFESVTRGSGQGQYQIFNDNDPDKAYIKVDYKNGIMLKKGTVATVKQEVGYIYERNKDTYTYVFSLKQDVMDSGKVLLTDGTKRKLSKLKNHDMVDPSQLILLECIFHDYDYKGKTLYLTVVDDYDIYNGESPSNYVGVEGGNGKLVQ